MEGLEEVMGEEPLPRPPPRCGEGAGGGFSPHHLFQHRAQELEHLLGRPVAGQSQVGIDRGVVLPRAG